ncbi:hypothetical protein KKB83_01500 [Patescibacteria group bacterium]|nr:hypothetical protein [Patescibacteria group bacterium]
MSGEKTTTPNTSIEASVSREVVLRRDVERMLEARGNNDHISYLARYVLSQSGETEPSGFEGADILIDRDLSHSSLFKFALSEFSALSPVYEWEIVGYDMDEAVYDKRFCSPMFDVQAREFIIKYADKLREQYPEVVGFIERIESPQTKRKLLLIRGDSRPPFLRAYDLDTAESVSEEAITEHRDDILELLEATEGRALICASRLLGKEVSPTDLDVFWPPELSQLAVENLSLINRVEVLSFIGRMGPNLIPEVQEDKLYIGDGIVSEDSIVGEISDFVLGHAEAFTPDVLALILKVPKEQITAGVTDAILASLVVHEDRDVFLSQRGHDKAVTVLGSFRGYESCQKTEHRLLDEMRDEKAVVLKLKYPDGKSVILGVKFTEMILAVCLESSVSDFPTQTSYLPIAQTLRWLRELRESGQVYHEVDVSDTKLSRQVWAVNRRAVYGEEEWAELLEIAEKAEQEARASVSGKN